MNAAAPPRRFAKMGKKKNTTNTQNNNHKNKNHSTPSASIPLPLPLPPPAPTSAAAAQHAKSVAAALGVSLPPPAVNQLGFRPKSNRPAATARQTPSYMLRQPEIFDPQPVTIDPWDKANQEEMARLEQSAADLPQLLEKFQELRAKERQEMVSRGLADDSAAKRDMNDKRVFRGSCLDMCPVYERVLRQVEHTIFPEEIDPATGKPSRTRAVKRFARSAGGPPPLPSDVRPPSVLSATLDYLISEIVPRLPQSHSFLWDRTRAIRNDFSFQYYSGPEAVECHERIARIHILCFHVMPPADRNFYSLEMDQFDKTLKSLTQYYDAARHAGRPPRVESEAEFRAYQLLYYIDLPEVEREVLALPREVVASSAVQLALKLRGLVSLNVGSAARGASQVVVAQIVSFFRLLRRREVPFLMGCILEMFFSKLRLRAVRGMARSFHKRGMPYPLPRLAEALAFDSEAEAEEFVVYYGLKVTELDGAPHVELQTFDEAAVRGKSVFPQPFSAIVEAKRDGKDYPWIVNGGSSVGGGNVAPKFSFGVNNSELGGAAVNKGFTVSGAVSGAAANKNIPLNGAAGLVNTGFVLSAPPAPPSKPFVDPAVAQQCAEAVFQRMARTVAQEVAANAVAEAQRAAEEARRAAEAAEAAEAARRRQAEAEAAEAQKAAARAAAIARQRQLADLRATITASAAAGLLARMLQAAAAEVARESVAQHFRNRQLRRAALRQLKFAVAQVISRRVAREAQLREAQLSARLLGAASLQAAVQKSILLRHNSGSRKTSPDPPEQPKDPFWQPIPRQKWLETLGPATGGVEIVVDCRGVGSEFAGWLRAKLAHVTADPPQIRIANIAEPPGSEAETVVVPILGPEGAADARRLVWEAVRSAAGKPAVFLMWWGAGGAEAANVALQPIAEELGRFCRLTVWNFGYCREGSARGAVNDELLRLFTAAVAQSREPLQPSVWRIEEAEAKRKAETLAQQVSAQQKKRRLVRESLRLYGADADADADSSMDEPSVASITAPPEPPAAKIAEPKGLLHLRNLISHINKRKLRPAGPS